MHTHAQAHTHTNTHTHSNTCKHAQTHRQTLTAHTKPEHLLWTMRPHRCDLVPRFQSKAQRVAAAKRISVGWSEWSQCDGPVYLVAGALWTVGERYQECCCAEPEEPQGGRILHFNPVFGIEAIIESAKIACEQVKQKREIVLVCPSRYHQFVAQELQGLGIKYVEAKLPKQRGQGENGGKVLKVQVYASQQM